MANPYFIFKQFTIRHDKCAMKVGTDGVLLGAWAHTGSAKRILDVGTGTGLIALMLAQRTVAKIDAIDIDESASQQAEENIEASPFHRQIHIFHASLEDYQASTDQRYDLIVSNPPYFSQSLKSPDEKRSKARHDDSLSLEELIMGCTKMLNTDGRIALILPVEQEERLTAVAQENLLYKIRQTNVIPVMGDQVKRILIELSPTPVPGFSVEDLTIEIERHHYTKEYQSLTRDYYLKM